MRDDHTTTVIGGIAVERLKSFVERIERLHEERRALSGDIAEVFKEAKGEGFDLPALRLVIRRRAMDPDERAELDTLSELYERAIGGQTTADEHLLTGPVKHRPRQSAAQPNGKARAAGKSDGLAGARENEHHWPPGSYGHADYAFGYAEGERESAASKKPRSPRPRLGVDFGKLDASRAGAGARAKA